MIRPRELGGPPANEARHAFGVDVGARLLGSPRVPRPEHLATFDLDVKTDLGNTKRYGFSPHISLDDSVTAATYVVKLIEPYGRRWLQTFSSLTSALAKVESYGPHDWIRTSGDPARLAMRLRAEIGDLDGVQRNLSRLMEALPPHRMSPKWRSVLAAYARTCGIDAPESLQA